MTRVLLIEDEAYVGGQIKEYLTRHSYDVDIASSFYDASYKLNIDYDVALLDINLPDKEGYFLIEKLKEKDIRVIVTSVKNDEDFIVKALDRGVDDYLTKPFSLAILRARIDAVLRTISIVDNKIISYRDIEIDLTSLHVTYKKEPVELTALEYEILVLFVKNPHRVYRRSQLLQMFWEDRDRFVNDNTLTSTIKRIREKLDKSLIKTVRGIGYRMD